MSRDFINILCGAWAITAIWAGFEGQVCTAGFAGIVALALLHLGGSQ